MKLKKWLLEKYNMSHDDYKNLDEFDQYRIFGEFQQYNANEQKINEMIKAGTLTVRKMTPEEKTVLERKLEKERVHRELSIKAGGIDEKGNYTALHHR